MTTVAPAGDQPPPTLAAADVARIRLTPWRVLRSEALKLRTVRSSWWSMAVAVAAMAGIGTVICWSTGRDWAHIRPRRQMRFNPLSDSLGGYLLAQLAVGVLGVLATSAEYSTGSIRSSLAAVPKRLPVLWSKLAVVVTVTAAAMIPSALFAFFASQRILAGHAAAGVPHVAWSMPTVARTVIGTALYLIVVAVLGVALGAILRHVAGAIAVLVGVLLILPAIAELLPDTWANRINKYLPSNAGQALLSVGGDSQTMTPWRGFALFCGYALGAVAVAAVLLRRRDA